MSAMNRRTGLATILLLLLVAFPARAQEATLRKLNAQAVDLYRQAKYAEAVRTGQDALKIAEKTFGPSHREVATA